MAKIGIDVGGTKTAFGLFTDDGKLLDKLTVPSDKEADSETFFDGIAENIHKLISSNGLTIDYIRGVGIGMPSFIIFDEGYIVKTVNLTKIKKFAARDYLEKLIGVPVVLDNDTHVAALAEHKLGAGRGKHNMIYCAVSTGIASGIIINDKLFRGSYGWAGETGHMLLTPHEGVECGCGHRGCFMSYTSGSMIVKHIQAKILSGEKTIMTDLAGGGENINAKHLLAAYKLDDSMAKWAIDQMANGLAVWLFNLYQCLNIDCFVFGGGLVKFGDVLFKPLREEFDRLNLDPYPVDFLFAQLEDDFGIVGASLLIE